jgi:predicted amidophosphoribosyltransferase
LLNLKNVFEFDGDLSFLSNVKTVVLVDDITTTGATMNEVAKLIKNRNQQISVW